MRKNIDDVRWVVNVRLQSSRCPNKVIRPFAGTTLVDILLEKIATSTIIPNDQFWFCAREPELLDKASEYRVQTFERSEAAVNSEGECLTELWDYWDKIGGVYLIKINCCAPFLLQSTIEDFSRAYMGTSSNGMFGVVETQDYYWDSTTEPVTPMWGKLPNTKTAPVTFRAAHCLYATLLEDIGRERYMWWDEEFKQPKLYPVKPVEALDIDYEWQFAMLEAYYKSTHGTQGAPVEVFC